jgi:hypothetical protein
VLRHKQAVTRDNGVECEYCMSCLNWLCDLLLLPVPDGPREMNSAKLKFCVTFRSDSVLPAGKILSVVVELDPWPVSI